MKKLDALEALDPKATDGLLVILNPQAMIDPAQVAAALTDALNRYGGSVFTSWMGGKDVDKGIRELDINPLTIDLTRADLVEAASA